MRKPGEGRPSRLWILFAALVIALATIAAGCGGSDDEGSRTDRWRYHWRPGHRRGDQDRRLREQRGPVRPVRRPDVGGAMLPLINRGATPVSGDPTEGV